MLDGLFVTPALSAITEALSSARAGDGPLAVIGNAKLAAALAKRDRARIEVLAVGLSARAAKKMPGALADLSTVADGSLAGVIGVDVATDDMWEATVRAWSRAVRDGGVIVFVDRGHAPEASRRALCAGLTELEQRRAGRAVVTSGLVSHL
jgi:hypothetical protein